MERQVISAGSGYSLAVTRDGNVYSWGRSDSGRLGTGNNKDVLTPKKLQTLTNVISVSAGYHHSLAITEDGSLYSWGGFDPGSSVGPISDALVPKKATLSNVVFISAGWWYSLAITGDGSLYSWGNNSNGQLGTGDRDRRLVPTKIESLADVIYASAGSDHSLAITEDGSLYNWGSLEFDEYGSNISLGIVPTKIQAITNSTSVFSGQDYCLAITEGGSVYEWGSLRSFRYIRERLPKEAERPQKITMLSNVISTAAKTGHALAVTEDGSVYSWGENSSGELGIGNKVDNDDQRRIIHKVLLSLN